MGLFDLPLELLEQIFSDAVGDRVFRRVMRLRLVNRQFRYLTDEAIFSSHILDDIAFGDELDLPIEQHDSPWAVYLRTYLGRRIYKERNEQTMRGQYRKAAEYLWATGSKIFPDMTFEECVYDMAGVALFINSSLETSVLLKSHSPKAMFGEPELATLFLNALIYTGLEPVAKALISEDPTDYWQYPTVAASAKPSIRKFLEMASFRGHLGLVEHLVQVEKNMTRNTWASMSANTASTIIRFASMGGHVSVVEYALENSSLLNARLTVATRRNLVAALSFATEPEIYRQLANILGYNSSSALDEELQDEVYECFDQAARLGNKEVVGYLLTTQDVCLNQPGADAHPAAAPLQEVEPGCDSFPSVVGTQSAFRPLISAIEGGHLETVKLLLQHGADPNWCPPTRTALMVAVHKGDVAIVRALVETGGARVDVGTPPPLVVAVQQENEEMFNYLVSKGALLPSPEAPDSEAAKLAGSGLAGGWAMSYAQVFGLDTMVNLLRKSGVTLEETLYYTPTREEDEHGRYLFGRRHYNASETVELPLCRKLSLC
ncbi:ankyrin [Xylariaceae sp. FL0594]|nr:ankyrin [Xylariaceae sp. FL0594]